VSIAVKICGLTDQDSLHAAVEGGAEYLGFVFVPSSKRVITTEKAHALLATLPQPTLCRFQRAGKNLEESGALILTALFVDPTDAEILSVCETLAPFIGLIQLHGNETPQRVRALREMTGLPVMKAISIATAKDFTAATEHEKAADMLLFDTKTNNAQTGGTGKSFDWKLLAGRSFEKPWMLAGGLNAKNVKKAVAQSGAAIIDLSSGVETDGKKDPAKIREMLKVCCEL